MQYLPVAATVASQSSASASAMLALVERPQYEASLGLFGSTIEWSRADVATADAEKSWQMWVGRGEEKACRPNGPT